MEIRITSYSERNGRSFETLELCDAIEMSLDDDSRLVGRLVETLVLKCLLNAADLERVLDVAEVEIIRT